MYLPWSPLSPRLHTRHSGHWLWGGVFARIWCQNLNLKCIVFMFIPFPFVYVPENNLKRRSRYCENLKRVCITFFLWKQIFKNIIWKYYLVGNINVLSSVSSPDYEAHWDDLRREREHEGERCQHLDQNHPAWTWGMSMDLCRQRSSAGNEGWKHLPALLHLRH